MNVFKSNIFQKPINNIFDYKIQYRKNNYSKSIRRIYATGEINWDPEGLLGAPQTGHIARRQIEKLAKNDDQFSEELKKAQDKLKDEIIARRQSRIIPDKIEDFVNYFINTDTEDIIFEVTRHRPKLNKDFFIYLDKKIGIERLSNNPDQSKLSELESLREYLKKAINNVDKKIEETNNAVDRMKKLLMAKDKKALILEMVGNNEIDSALLDLLKENEETAERSGETEKALFMSKIYNACKKYYIET